MMIKLFWHICMVNHWRDIVREQIVLLTTSGLYDACSEIHIGCVGLERNRRTLELFILRHYPKLKLAYHSNTLQEYEFPTLHLIEQDNSDYIGFYFHTKGVTKPKDTMQPKERQFLNEMMIEQWRLHVMIIETGYDVSALSYQSIPNKFSGNYFWFHRQRINRLMPLDTLDHSNRYNAEKWIYTPK